MLEKFKRPTNLPYPLIHHTFFVKESQEDVEYYVQDLTEEKPDEAVELYVKCILPEETFTKSAKLSKNPDAVSMISTVMRQIIKDKLSLACFKMNTHELVGANFMIAKTRGIKEKYDIPIPEVQLLLKMIDFIDDKMEVAEHFNIDHHLSGVGLGVKHEYRGKGIATEILKARVPLLQSIGLNLTSTNFSGIASQKSAFKAGFEETLAVSYEEIQGKFTGLDFSTADATHCKIMTLKV